MDVRSAGDQKRLSQYRKAGGDCSPLHPKPVRHYHLSPAGWFAHGSADCRMVVEIEAGRNTAGNGIGTTGRCEDQHLGAGHDLRMEGVVRNERPRKGSAGTEPRAVSQVIWGWSRGCRLRAGCRRKREIFVGTL